MKRLGAFVNEGAGPGFDSVRVLAAVGVLISHAFSLTIEDGREHEPLVLLTNTWSIGAVCVAIFFIVSGFLIAQSTDRNRSPLRFSEKRVLRIFPALAVNVFLLTLLLGPALTTLSLHEYLGSAATWGYLKGAFFLPHAGQLPGVFLTNPLRQTVNGSLWTLRSEVACYAVIGALVYVFRFRSPLPYVLLTTTVLVVAAVKHAPVSSHVHLFGLFLIGSSLYWSRQYIPLGRFAMTLATLLFAVSLRWSYLAPLGLVGLAYATIAAGYLFRGFHVLHHRDYSYGLYLWAFPVQQTLIHFHRMAWWVNALVAFPITLMLAMLSWHFIEKPMKAIKLSLWREKVPPSLLVTSETR